ncbi:hypothetical protein X750_28290 [Mesorhizobium sp. LNJC394B00]|nr:hypothetical protein X750_28290 [Mesorhizobium sp. LNJC394B00]
MFLAICAPFLGEIGLTQLFCGTRPLAISMKRIMRGFFMKPHLHFERAGVC